MNYFNDNPKIKIFIDDEEALSLDNIISPEDTENKLNLHYTMGILRNLIRYYDLWNDEQNCFCTEWNYGFDLDEFRDNGGKLTETKWKVYWRDAQKEQTYYLNEYMDFTEALDWKGTIAYSWFVKEYNWPHNIRLEEYPEHTIATDHENNHIIIWMIPEGFDNSIYENAISYWEN